jgi:hypothetical protein
MTGRLVGRRQMPLQPQQFGNFHFRRDRAADIAEHVVVGLVDPASLRHRAMIHPDDDVSPWVAGATYRQRIACGIDDHKRTGRIETHALDGRSRERGFRHGGADRGGAGRPDLGRGLFRHAARLVPHRDRMPGGRQQGSVLVEYSSARARCPDIDADEGLLHHNPASGQRQLTSTYNLRQRGQHFRSSGWRRPTPGTGRRMQSRRPPPSAPSAYRRSRHHTSAGCF